MSSSSDEPVSTGAVCFGSDTYECPTTAINETIQSYFKLACADTSVEPPVWYIPFGIALGSFGSVGINLGNNLQALGLAMRATELIAHTEKLEKENYDVDNDSELPLLPRDHDAEGDAAAGARSDESGDEATRLV